MKDSAGQTNDPAMGVERSCTEMCYIEEDAGELKGCCGNY